MSLDVALLRMLERISNVERSIERLRSVSRPLAQEPYVRVYDSGWTTIGSGPWTLLYWDSTVNDPLDMVATSDSKLIAPIAGFYVIGANIQWNATIGASCGICLDYKRLVNISMVAGTYQLYQECVTGIYLGADDWIEVYAYQQTGVNQTCNGISFWGVRVSDP